MSHQEEISTHGAINGFGVDAELTAAGIDKETRKKINLDLSLENEADLEQ